MRIYGLNSDYEGDLAICRNAPFHVSCVSLLLEFNSALINGVLRRNVIFDRSNIVSSKYLTHPTGVSSLKWCIKFLALVIDRMIFY